MAKKKNNSGKWIAAGTVLCAAIIAMSFLQLGDSIVYFYTPTEAFAKANEIGQKTVKVGGLVKPGSVDWNARELDLKFIVTDNGQEIAVQHKGTPPDMFKEGQGVVVEGRLDGSRNLLVSQQLMVKHSEEYIKPDDPGSIDRELLEKSLFKQ